MPMHRALLVSLALYLFVAACGSDGPKDPPSIAVTSHASGMQIFGSRSVTLAGSLTSSTSITAVQVLLNGLEVSGASHTQAAFTAPLQLANRTNAIEVRVSNAAGKTAVASLTLEYPFVIFTDFQAATLAIGQPDLATGTEASSPTANTFDASIYGDPLVEAGRLYLPNFDYDRVLGYDTIPSASGAAASFVLGQPDFIHSGGPISATVMDGPQTLRAAGGRLFVAEYNASRITVFDPIPNSTQPSAVLAIGQHDLVTTGSDCTAVNLYHPESLFIVGGKLIVADSGNNRVLIWNAIPTVAGVAADLVLGQVDFTHCKENDENGDGVSDPAPSAKTLAYPSDVWTDGVRLLVADPHNNRILVWNTFPTVSQAPADLVLGQEGMTTAASGLGRSGLDYPYFLHSNGNQLFAADELNNRILIWDSFPTTSNQPADHVLGQGDFDHHATNDDNQDGTSDANPSARTINDPCGIYLHDTKLFVADLGNARYLVFDGT